VYENDYGSLIEPWKLALIRRRARRMGFRRDELPDLQQQIVLALCELRFDPERADGATEKTVVTALIDRQLRSMRRTRTRRERLFEQLDIDAEPDDDAFRDLGEEGADLGVDVRAALAELSDRDRAICRALADGETIDGIARQQRRSWHTIKTRAESIQRRFEQIGLHGWLGH